jgi:CRISPR-associated endoribonuclease Cas6
MQLLTNEAELIICFYLPQAAENFIKGLFIHQEIEIVDQYSKAVFQVKGIESLTETKAAMRVLLQPLSPVVAGRKNERGHYDYRSPEDADFSDCLVHNWVEKYAAIHETDESQLNTLREAVQVAVKLYPHPPQQRLITIKGGTREETKIRGYTKFKMEVKAPKELLDVAFGAGLGLYNAQGMGCVSELRF